MTVSLPAQIFLAMALGLLAGWGLPDWVPYVAIVGELFLLLLKMIIVPLIFTSVTVGIGGIGSFERLGRIGLVTVLYYGITMALAVVIGLVLVNLIQPGVGAVIGSGSAPTEEIAPQTIGVFLRGQMVAIVKNPFEALANGDILAIIVFAMVFGAALVAIGNSGGPLLSLLKAANDAIMWVTGRVMWLAPYGVFALLANVVAKSGLDVLSSLLAYIVTVLLGLTLHVLCVLTPIVWLLGRISPLAFWSGMREAFAISLSTASSSATLPVSMYCVQRRLGVSERITSFVLPLGATVNMDGTALYEAVAAVFIAQAYGIDLGLGQQVLIFLTAMGASVGAAGIPGAGLVTMAMVLQAVGLPLEGIGLLLAVDRVLDMCRTTVNVAGDAVGAVIVERLEGKQGGSGAQ